MGIPRRDVIATALVACGGALYILWVAELSPPGLDTVRAVGLAILVLGFVASASAVVPGFATLMRGDRTYLVVTAALGTVAFLAGVQTLLRSSEAALAVLVSTTAVLWLVSTVHHVLLAGATAHRPAGRPSPARHKLRHA